MYIIAGLDADGKAVDQHAALKVGDGVWEDVTYQTRPARHARYGASSSATGNDDRFRTTMPSRWRKPGRDDHGFRFGGYDHRHEVTAARSSCPTSTVPGGGAAPDFDRTDRRGPRHGARRVPRADRVVPAFAVRVRRLDLGTATKPPLAISRAVAYVICGKLCLTSSRTVCELRLASYAPTVYPLARAHTHSLAHSWSRS